jgi:hypothetical protein
MNSETRQCQNCKTDFIIEPDDFSFYEKMKVPAPTFCPECREIRRMSFRNEHSLYKRNCDLCGQSVVSRISPNKKYPMYCQECWWSDRWSGNDYGRDYDFSRSFFEQFRDLLFSTPNISIQNSNSINSEWVNQETDDKNCYLNVGGHYNEDSAYNTYEIHGKNCLDNFWLFNSENCSNDTNCEKSFNLHFSNDCRDCMDSYFLSDCRNCSHCIGCAGLRNQKYCIFNVQHTKDEYEEFLKQNPVSSCKNLKEITKKSEEFWLKFPRRNVFIENSNNVSGNYIRNSKNSHGVFYATDAENVRYSNIIAGPKDSYDCTSFGYAEICYEVASGGGDYRSKFTSNCMSSDPLKKTHSFNLEYCLMVISSSNCFGCANLRNAEYSILNKRYTKEEYDKMIPKIKKHMDDMPYIDKNGRIYKYGEFFPPTLSLYGYNETASMDYYPLSKDEAIKKGFLWEDYQSNIHYEFSDYEIPDDIKDVNDDIVNKILKCEKSGKAYKIIQTELNFYRKTGLPIPRVSPIERHKERMSKLLPRKLFNRSCAKCGAEIQTPYSSNRPEVIYCKNCYQQEVY